MIWTFMLVSTAMFVSTAQALCNVGQYTDTESNTCHNCPTGFFSDRGDVNKCIQCDIGRYQEAIGSSDCKSCPDGYAQPLAMKSSCEACARGLYVSPSSTCVAACPPGSWLSGTQCAVCNAGTYSQDNSDACLDCNPGTYKEDDGPQPCVQCPKGYVSTTDKKSCLECDAGTEVINDVCADCPTGKYELDDSCTNCGPGKFSADQKQDECTMCTAGQYEDEYMSSACKECPVGTYSFAGQRKCTTCPRGYGSALPGLTRCAECVGAQTVDGQCKNCESGLYMRDKSCVRCPIGYASGPKASSCHYCETHTYSDDAILNADGSCKTCVAGFPNVRDGPGSWKCCITGCSDCQAGKYRTGDICASCPRGFVSQAGADECTACNARHGEYADTIASKECKLCVEGQDSTGVACIDCGPGTSEFMFDCSDCPRGWFSENDRNPDCTRCALQTTTEESGSNAASKCSVQCEQNEIVDRFGKCQFCGGGKFVDGYHCTDCPKGWFKDTPLDAVCSACPVGFNTETTGQLNCYMCPPGEVCGCPWGQFGTDPDNCRDCPVGYFSKGSIECTACATHTYQNEEGQGSCKSCPPGRLGDVVASEVCKDCAAGKFQMFEGSGACEECPRGRYAGKGQSECTACLPGTSTLQEASTGLVQCISCPEGTMESEHLCVNCNEGMYQNETGQVVCKACPGETWSSPGTIDEKDCFRIGGLVTYTFGNVEDSKKETPFTTLCELRPNFVMLCPACTCDADSRNGFWAGPLCNECERGFATRFCTSICPGYDGMHDSTICNGNGRCWFGRQGSGLCYCGGKSEIDSSAENVFVDVRYCPAGQICPGYGVEKVPVMTYIPLYYLINYRQYTSFVLQMTQYTPQRGHMWFKRFSPTKGFENTCTQCTSKFSDSVLTSVGFWNKDDEYELFPTGAQTANGFHGENCQYECAVCLNGGYCVHSPHPFRYSYTIQDTFEEQTAVIIPTTACLCSANVFDAAHMCCPNGFQPYIYDGKRETTPYTRFSTVPYVTSIDNNIGMGYYFDKDVYLQPDIETPYAEPDDGFITVTNGRVVNNEVQFKQVGPYNKHVYHGTAKEICRACPGLFGKGVRAVDRLIETEQEAENYWWNFPASAGSKKCQGQGVCDFYNKDSQIDVDFMGSVNDWALLHRGTLCKISIEGFVGYDRGEPINTLAQCVAYGLQKGANFVGWAPEKYLGGTDEDMKQTPKGEVINYESRSGAETFAKSEFATAWAKKGKQLYAIVDGELPIPDSDSEYAIYPMLDKRCIAYRSCPEVRPISAVSYRAFNVYTIERGRGDERLDTATFDRFDTCFTYTKNYDHDDSKENKREKFGLYLTQNYEQGDDPFLGGLCPKGYFCTQNSKGIGFKEACPVGYYQPLEGQTRAERDVHCSRVALNTTGCQVNLATKNSTDYVDQICLRCPRDTYAPTGSYECEQCPPGRVKKVSGNFDPNAVDVYNIPTMTTPYWFYIQNEGGTEADDCAIVPPSVIHVPTANSKMEETPSDDQYMPVVSCPFGYSSQPGTYIVEDIWNMQSILKKDKSIMEAPYIYIDGDIQVVAANVPCDCIVSDEETTFHVPVSEELCDLYSRRLSDEGVLGNIKGVVDGIWYGCIKHSHSSWVKYNRNENFQFNYPNDVKFICQRIVKEKTLMEEFVSTYCYECPGDSMTGPGSGICTTCTANLIKKNMKRGLQKLVSNSEARMYHCDIDGQPIPAETPYKDPDACPDIYIRIHEHDMDISVADSTLCKDPNACEYPGQSCTTVNTAYVNVMEIINATYSVNRTETRITETKTRCCTNVQEPAPGDWYWSPEIRTDTYNGTFCSVEHVECNKHCQSVHPGSVSYFTPVRFCMCFAGELLVGECTIGLPLTQEEITTMRTAKEAMQLAANDPNCKEYDDEGICEQRRCPTISAEESDKTFDIEYEKELLSWYYLQQEDRIWPAKHVFGFIEDPSMVGARVEVTITDCVLACSTVFDQTYDYKSKVRRVRVGYARDTDSRSFCMCNEGNPENEKDAYAVAVDSDPSPGTYCADVQGQNEDYLLTGDCFKLGDLKVAWYESVIVDDWAETEFPLCGLCAPGKKFTGSECVDCAMGQYTSDMIQSMNDNCQLCPTGFFQDATGSAGCRECRPGFFGPEVAMPKCSECVPGQHQDEFKMNACKNCPAGYQQDDRRGIICKICPVGRYESSTRNDTHVNDEACTRCPAGRYEDQRGSPLCKVCEPGRFQTDTGEISCQLCDFGKFEASEEQPVACDFCPTGFHQDEKGQPDCKSCKGTNADIVCTADEDCLWKPSGGTALTDAAGDAKYTHLPGMKDCLDCQAAYFCQVDAQQTPCATGSAMPPGWYSDQCYECNGAYYANPDKNACEKCEQPSIIDATRSACSDCLATEGKIALPSGCGVAPFDVGCDECFQCAIDEKSEGNACVKCCTEGEVCDTPRQDPTDGTKCSDCADGTYWDGEECVSCPSAGWKVYSTNCKDCGPNGWRLHWYNTKRKGSKAARSDRTKKVSWYTGPTQDCCWDADDYTQHGAWVVTGDKTGRVDVDDRTDDWLKLYVQNIATSEKIRDWKRYGLHKGGDTSLPANSVFNVQFKWSSNDGVAKFKVKLHDASAFSSGIAAGHGAQIYRKC